MSTAGEMRHDRDPGIRFDPDGSSTGGRVILAAGAQKMEIGIDWLTGRVRVINVP
jgi:general secretion pathway protein H